jgi:hypothetical protein
MKLNEEKCREFGEHFKTLEIRDPITRIHGKDLNDKLFFTLNFVGICHSINFDFLSQALAKVQREHPEKFNPGYMETISNEELYDWLKEYPKKWRLRIETRGELVRDISKQLNKHYQGSALKLFQDADFNVPKIYQKMDIFKAFSEDPHRKKTSCAIGEIDKNKVVELKGMDSVKPQMDYHIARTVLRNGMVRLDPVTLAHLIGFKEMDEKLATEVRGKCMDALILAGKFAGTNVDDIRLLYWYVGRECCDEDNPCCEGCTKNECAIPKGAPFRKERCSLAEVCASVQDKNLRRVREPNFKTTFY